LGFSLGHLDKETVGLITLVGLITISASTYLILYSYPIYERLAPYLSVFERKVPYREAQLDYEDRSTKTDVILFGLGRFGLVMANTLKDKHYHVLGVDFNPEFVENVAKHNLNTRYGDAEDPEFLTHLPLNQAKWVVSTIRDKHTNVALLKTLRHEAFSGKIAVAAKDQLEADFYKKEGADLVLIPYHDAAIEAAHKIANY
jgi:voltage-gated potassium channel Kch